MTFEEELRAVINKYSKENDSNTPDFILARYLGCCLDAFNFATNEREMWYGRLIIDKTKPIKLEKTNNDYHNPS